MSSVETGQMSAVETGQMTAAETSVVSQQKTSVLVQCCPWLLLAATGCYWLMLADEGLPNREGPKPGQIGGGRSAGVPLGRGVTPGGVKGSALADRSEGSGQ